MIIRKWATDHAIHIENFEDPWIFCSLHAQSYENSRISWCPITKDLRVWFNGCWGREQHAETWEDAKAIIHTAWGLESLGPPRNSFQSMARIP